MGFLTEPERAFATAFSDLAVCNPYLPERWPWSEGSSGDGSSRPGRSGTRARTHDNPNISP